MRDHEAKYTILLHDGDKVVHRFSGIIRNPYDRFSEDMHNFYRLLRVLS
jgi:hypothetical protein